MGVQYRPCPEITICPMVTVPSMSAAPSPPPKLGKLKRWRKNRPKNQPGTSQGTDNGGAQPHTAFSLGSASEKSYGDKQTKWVKIWLKKLQRRKSNASQTPMAHSGPPPPIPPAPRIITLAEQLQEAQSEEFYGSDACVRPRA